MAEKFEYEFFDITPAALTNPDKLIEQLNGLGNEGWSYLAMMAIPSGSILSGQGPQNKQVLLMQRLKKQGVSAVGG